MNRLIVKVEDCEIDPFLKRYSQQNLLNAQIKALTSATKVTIFSQSESVA